MLGDDIAKATGSWITMKLNIQNRQTQTEVVHSVSAMIIKVLKEPPKERKKQKNINTVGIFHLMRLATLLHRCTNDL